MSLDRLSAECLGFIADYLPFWNLQALLVLGSPALKAKLQAGVTEIRALMKPMRKWSYAAFKFPHLRYLQVECPHESLFSPFLAPADEILPLEELSSLETLIVRSLLGTPLLSWLNRGPGDPYPLPSLKRLSVHTNASPTQVYLEQLPPTLTDLSIRISSPSDSWCPLTQLSSLPRGLIRLSLPDLPFLIGSEMLSEVKLPPHLEYLNLNLKSLWDSEIDVLELVFQVVPQTLVEMHVMLQHTSVKKAIVSSMPPALEVLSVSAIEDRSSSCVVVFTQPLPPTLRVFNMPLTSCRLQTNLDHFVLPSRITSLSFLDQTGIVDLGALPVTLTHLALGLSKMAETVGDFSLEDLTHLKSLLLPSVEPRFSLSKPSTWEALHSRLEVLHIGTGMLASCDGLIGPWTRLRELKLYIQDAMFTGDTRSAPRDWLPRTLERLTMHSYSDGQHLRRSFLWPLMSENKSLKLVDYRRMAHIVPSVEIVSKFISSLPSGLETFRFGSAKPIPEDPFLALPSNLKELVLEGSQITVNHLGKLPSSLTSLQIYSNRTPNISAVQKNFPRNLVYMVGVEFPRNHPYWHHMQEHKRQCGLPTPV